MTVRLRDRGRRGRAHGARALRRRRRRRARARCASGSASRTQGHGSFSDSITIYFRADVRALIGDRNLSVIYVFHPRLHGLLPLLARRATPASSSSTRRSARTACARTSSGEDTSEERCIEYVPRGARRAGHRRSRSRTSSAGARWPTGRSGFARAASSSPATRRTSCRRPAASAATPASRTRTTWPGSSRSSCAATPAPGCSTPTTPSGARSREFTVEQAYTRYVLRLDPSSARTTCMPIVDEATVELGYRYHSDAVVPEAGEDGAALGEPARADGAAGLARAAPRVARARTEASRRSTSCAAASSCSPGRKDRSGATRRRLRPRLLCCADRRRRGTARPCPPSAACRSPTWPTLAANQDASCVRR